jgi:hypothetical protein
MQLSSFVPCRQITEGFAVCTASRTSHESAFVRVTTTTCVPRQKKQEKNQYEMTIDTSL